MADKLNEFYVSSVVEINRGIGSSTMEDDEHSTYLAKLRADQFECQHVNNLEKCLLEIQDEGYGDKTLINDYCSEQELEMVNYIKYLGVMITS